jgi:hypothetical protein
MGLPAKSDDSFSHKSEVDGMPAVLLPLSLPPAAPSSGSYSGLLTGAIPAGRKRALAAGPAGCHLLGGYTGVWSGEAPKPAEEGEERPEERKGLVFEIDVARGRRLDAMERLFERARADTARAPREGDAGDDASGIIALADQQEGLLLLSAALAECAASPRAAGARAAPLVEAAVVLLGDATEPLREALRTLDSVLVRVLENSGSDLLACSVAAQRARLVPFRDPYLKTRAWRAIRGWIDRLPASEQPRAALALPSVLALGGIDGLEFLVGRLRGDSRLLRWAAATGIADWNPAAKDLRGSACDGAFETVAALLNEEAQCVPQRGGVELEPALVRALATLTGRERLERAAPHIAKAFLRPRGYEDAAAIEASRLLCRRFAGEAIRALREAFRDAESFDRFAALLAATG